MTEPSAGSFAELAGEAPYPGVTRRSFDTSDATIAQYEFLPGASFPVHRHPQEQVTLIEQGTVTMWIGDGALHLTAGDWSVVPGDVEHGVTAGPDGARFVAIVVPRRAPDGYEVTGR